MVDMCHLIINAHEMIAFLSTDTRLIQFGLHFLLDWLTLQRILSIPTHLFATCVQINHFCNYQCNYLL
jgi:hypothetical protein